LQLSECFDAELGLARQAYYALQDACREWVHLSNAVQHVMHDLTQAGDSELNAVLSDLQAMAQRLEQYQPMIEQREQALGCRARLLNTQATTEGGARDVRAR
ncbi:MAG: hypothetical protein LC737_08765, partial [Chloroflexi bacterium]|nr:hypothetical protein [Chloroflexota bacterium]